VHRRDWRLKAGVQKALSAAPRGHVLNYALQKRIGGLPLPAAQIDDAVRLGVTHLETVAALSPVPPGDASFFEFGAGWDLRMPLVFRALGVRRQIVVDIRPLLRPELVADLARRLHEVTDPPAGWDPAPPPPAGLLDRWLRDLGIDYRAPADARATGLAPRTIDVVTSSNTLEHIPPDDIVAIGREVSRVLAPQGLASFEVDYSDHYSHFDPSLSPWNFLGIPERRWAWLNSSLHYQNRLRHRDYRALLTQAHLSIVEERLRLPDDRHAAAATIRALPPVRPFADVPPDELAILGAYFVLRPAAG
jgi:hypothetical protein